MMLFGSLKQVFLKEKRTIEFIETKQGTALQSFLFAGHCYD